MKNEWLKSLIYIYFFLDSMLIIFSIFMDINFILNSQISFFCSLIILSASIYAYKKRVFEDIFDCDFSDQNSKNFKKFIPKKLTTFFSPFKILSYVLLIIAFFCLKNSGKFEIIPFLLGILLMPIGVIIFAFRLKLYDS